VKGRILLVDDNEDFLDSVGDVLETEGYDVVAATSGEEAIRLSTQGDFAAIVMDIKMPGLNGVESFLQMKRRDPDVQVILVTAYELERLVSQAVEGGVCAVLSKPLDMGAFLNTLARTATAGRGGLLLLADDDAALCASLFDALREEGYEVAVATDGEQALRLAQEQAVDLLLLDMRLPPANGLDLYRKIKAVRPDIVAVVITGFAQECEDLVRQTLAENAHTCMSKPLDMECLLTTLASIRSAKRSGTYRKPEAER